MISKRPFNSKRSIHLFSSTYPFTENHCSCTGNEAELTLLFGGPMASRMCALKRRGGIVGEECLVVDAVLSSRDFESSIIKWSQNICNKQVSSTQQGTNIFDMRNSKDTKESAIKSPSTGLKNPPQNSCLPGIYVCDFIRKEGLCRCNPIEMSHAGFG